MFIYRDDSFFQSSVIFNIIIFRNEWFFEFSHWRTLRAWTYGAGSQKWFFPLKTDLNLRRLKLLWWKAQRLICHRKERSYRGEKGTVLMSSMKDWILYTNISHAWLSVAFLYFLINAQTMNYSVINFAYDIKQFCGIMVRVLHSNYMGCLSPFFVNRLWA